MYATRDLLARFYLIQPPWTLRAVCGVRGDEVLGLCGYFIDEERAVIFSDLRPQALRYKREILRIARQVLTMALNTGLPVHAINDDRYAGSPRLLQHLGFENYRGIWVCQ